MKLGPIRIKDKLGREVILRNAETKDAEEMIRYLEVTSKESRFLMREPDEVYLTAAQEREFLKNMAEDDCQLMLIALIDGKHAGNCSLMRITNYRRYRHRCEIAIALYQEFCGVGIGKKMLETVLEAARNCGYEQAELEVIAGNDNAKALYGKLGFVEYGRFPDNMKYSDGTYADSFWMMKKLQ